MTTNGVTMKKIQILAASILLMSAALSFSGANADEKSNGGDNKGNSSNQSQEFKGSGTRSHGHPVANLSENPSAGSRQDQNSFVNNDDQTSEIEWQKWNKANSKAAAKALGSTASNPIIFHAGGPIGLYTGPTQIIPVWVGGWSDSNKEFWNARLSALVAGLKGLDISIADQVFNTNTLYFTSKSATTTKLSWASSMPSATVPATLQKASGGIIPVSDANVATYINSAISTGKVQVPAVGVRPLYVYIGAADTRLSSGFGTAYCGWHTYGTLGSKNIPYIAIQDFGSKYYSACSAQTISPNGNVALDAMASVLVHEIDEAITDADLRTWYDARGAENADKCAWTFTPISMVGAAKFNFSSGGYNFLIQRNWLANNLVTDSVAGTACSLKG